MKMPLGLVLILLVSFASCARHPATRITVKAPDRFSGYIFIDTCVDGAREPVVLDAVGNGNTLACPPGDVVVTVIEPTRTFDVPSTEIQIRRTRNGVPTSVIARVQ